MSFVPPPDANIKISYINIKKPFLWPKYSLYSILSLILFGKWKRKLKSERFHIENTCFSSIFSLGDRCATAQILRKAKLRTWASPFDWIGGASLDLRINLIKSRFSGFFLRQNLVSTNQVDDKGKYRVNDRFLGFRFLHDFSSPDIDAEYQYVFEKYTRRINRIYTKSSSGSVLICYIETSREPEDQTAHILKNIESLKEALGANKLSLFYVHSASSNNHGMFEKISIIGRYCNIFKLSLYLNKDYSSSPLPKEISAMIFKSIYAIFKNSSYE